MGNKKHKETSESFKWMDKIGLSAIICAVIAVGTYIGISKHDIDILTNDNIELKDRIKNIEKNYELKFQGLEKRISEIEEYPKVFMMGLEIAKQS